MASAPSSSKADYVKVFEVNYYSVEYNIASVCKRTSYLNAKLSKGQLNVDILPSPSKNPLLSQLPPIVLAFARQFERFQVADGMYSQSDIMVHASANDKKIFKCVQQIRVMSFETFMEEKPKDTCEVMFPYVLRRTQLVGGMTGTFGDGLKHKLKYSRSRNKWLIKFGSKVEYHDGSTIQVDPMEIRYTLMKIVPTSESDGSMYDLVYRPALGSDENLCTIPWPVQGTKEVGTSCTFLNAEWKESFKSSVTKFLNSSDLRTMLSPTPYYEDVENEIWWEADCNFFFDQRLCTQIRTEAKAQGVAIPKSVRVGHSNAALSFFMSVPSSDDLELCVPISQQRMNLCHLYSLHGIVPLPDGLHCNAARLLVDKLKPTFPAIQRGYSYELDYQQKTIIDPKFENWDMSQTRSLRGEISSEKRILPMPNMDLSAEKFTFWLNRFAHTYPRYQQVGCEAAPWQRSTVHAYEIFITLKIYIKKRGSDAPFLLGLLRPESELQVDRTYGFDLRQPTKELKGHLCKTVLTNNGFVKESIIDDRVKQWTVTFGTSSRTDQSVLELAEELGTNTIETVIGNVESSDYGTIINMGTREFPTFAKRMSGRLE